MKHGPTHRVWAFAWYLTHTHTGKNMAGEKEAGNNGTGQKIAPASPAKIARVLTTGVDIAGIQ